VGVQAVLNLCENRLCLYQRGVIRKAQNVETLLVEPLRACRIPRPLILMLPAIQFDDQHPFDAAEIDDVRIDRMLAAKLDAQSMPAQTHPEPALRVSLVTAQSACPIA
jgi:hypothetical protein